MVALTGFGNPIEEVNQELLIVKPRVIQAVKGSKKAQTLSSTCEWDDKQGVGGT